MKLVRALLLSCVLCSLQTTAISQEREPLPLQDRVAEAGLIVLGTLHPEVTISRFQTLGHVDVERVLLGTARTNTALAVQFAADRRFTPGIFSTTHRITPTNRYICFLARSARPSGSTNSRVFRPVGTHGWASDGFELATEKVLQETLELIADRNKKK
jgi:hypothetical protein